MSLGVGVTRGLWVGWMLGREGAGGVPGLGPLRPGQRRACAVELCRAWRAGGSWLGGQPAPPNQQVCWGNSLKLREGRAGAHV